MNRRMHLPALLVAAAIAGMLPGCGGGGGGSSAPPANVVGRVLFTATQAAPNPAATVQIGGVSGTTDTQGNFVLQNVPSNATQMTITGQGIKTLTQTLPTLTPNTSNNLGTIDIVDTTGTYDASITGTVVSADTQAPIAGARVLINGQAVTTTSTGTFTFSNLPVGLGGTGITIGSISATGYADKGIQLDLPLGTGANTIPNQPLAPAVGNTIPGSPFDIFGIVQLQGTTDFSNTTVVLTNRTTQAEVARLTTGADGSYGFWVPSGAYHITASHDGFVTGGADVDLARQDQPQQSNLTLHP